MTELTWHRYPLPQSWADFACRSFVVLFPQSILRAEDTSYSIVKARHPGTGVTGWILVDGGEPMETFLRQRDARAYVEAVA